MSERRELDRHVVPADSEPAHEAEATCWCQPVVNWENPINGARVYVHRRYIDGPVYLTERDEAMG